MRLLTLGDSFTYGEELEDKNQAWPYRLGELLSAQVTNLGLPGNSGHAICRQLLENFALSQGQFPDLVVIGWPSPGRMEFADDAGSFSIWPGYGGNLFKQDQPWRCELLEYFNRYHDSQWLFERYLQNIIMIQRFLEGHQVNYLMMNVLGNEYYFRTCCDKLSYYDHMINSKYFIDWKWNDQKGMIEWVYCSNGNTGPYGHFLEQGHQIVADKVYEHIRNIGWVS